MMNSYVLIYLAFVSCYLYFLIASFLQDSSKFGFFFSHRLHTDLPYTSTGTISNSKDWTHICLYTKGKYNS